VSDPWWLLVSAGAVGYAVGSLSPATLVARRAGLDLRAIGSGNPGATNVGRALGRRMGAIVALADVAKGAVPAATFGAASASAGLVAGIAAVLGHITSPLLRGRGGKGVATAFGALLGSHPAWALVAIVVWIVGVAVVRVVAVGSVAASLSVLVTAIVVGAGRPALAWAAALFAIVTGRHLGNLRRWWRRSRRRGRRVVDGMARRPRRRESAAAE
jgi:glycerol-3-phosphate acyltransferase PlsY